jgi:signal transduction histidine kinase
MVTSVTSNNGSGSVLSTARQSSLQRRLLTLLGATLSVLAVIIGAGVLYFVYRTEQTSWQGRQTEASRNAGETVGSFVSGVGYMMQSLSFLDGNYLKTSPTVIQQTLNETPAFLELLRLDKDGNVVAAASRGNPELANLFTLAQSRWFIEASTGHQYISDIQISQDNQLYVIMAVPASENGVVAARLSMNVLWDVVSTIRFGETGHAYVVNHQGQVLAHTNHTVVLNNTNIANEPEMALILSAPDNHWTGNYTNLEGVQVVGTSAAIPQTDWIVITEVSQDEAFALTREALILLDGGILVFALLAVWFTARILRRFIFNPVEALRGGAEIIGKGNLAYHIPVVQRDEIGQVAATFNEMADQLRNREELLAAKTDSLAKELTLRQQLIEELKIANEQALESSRLKSEFLSTMSHELRTPLNSVIGFSGILREGMAGELTDMMKSMVDQIYTSSQHLLSLISNILDLSKIEAGRLEIVRATVDLPQLASEWKSTLNVLAEKKRLTFNVMLDPALPEFFYTDKVRLTQIVANLVGNAIKFTEAGYVNLDLTRDTQTLIIKVTDTGIGIPPHALGYIFDEFRQVDGSTERRYEGTGLGLAIVRKLVEAMGGKIGVTSRLGEGSTFTVTLPIVVSPEVVSVN